MMKVLVMGSGGVGGYFGGRLAGRPLEVNYLGGGGAARRAPQGGDADAQVHHAGAGDRCRGEAVRLRVWATGIVGLVTGSF
jgi:hypothetical protein